MSPPEGTFQCKRCLRTKLLYLKSKDAPKLCSACVKLVAEMNDQRANEPRNAADEIYDLKLAIQQFEQTFANGVNALLSVMEGTDEKSGTECSVDGVVIPNQPTGYTGPEIRIGGVSTASP